MFFPSLILIVWSELSGVVYGDVFYTKMLSIAWFVMLFSGYFLFQGMIISEYKHGAKTKIILISNILLIIGYIIYLFSGINILRHTFEFLDSNIADRVLVDIKILKFYKLGAYGLIIVAAGMFNLSYNIIMHIGNLIRRFKKA